MTRDQLLDQLAATRERHALDLGRLTDVHAAWREAEDIIHALDLPAGSLNMADVLAAVPDPVHRERLRHLVTVRMYALDPPSIPTERDAPHERLPDLESDPHGRHHHPDARPHPPVSVPPPSPGRAAPRIGGRRVRPPVPPPRASHNLDGRQGG